jgi:hypothetical protein
MKGSGTRGRPPQREGGDQRVVRANDCISSFDNRQCHARQRLTTLLRFRHEECESRRVMAIVMGRHGDAVGLRAGCVPVASVCSRTRQLQTRRPAKEGRRGNPAYQQHEGKTADSRHATS